MMTRPEVVVHRHVATCRTYGAGSLTDATLRDSLEGPFRERLADAVSGAGLVDGYWLVRRMDLRTHVGLGWTPHQLGAAVARCAVNQLAMLLDAGSDAANVLWFPDRASFLARYLVDVADGWTAGRWEYAQFRSRDAATALVDLAAEEPAELLAALLVAQPRERQRVLAGLTPGGEEELTRALTAGTDALAPDRAAVVAAVRELATRGMLHGRGCTPLGLALAATQGTTALAAVVDPAREVADLVRAIEASGSNPGAAYRLVSTGDWSGLLGILGLGAADIVLAFVGWPALEREQLRTACAPDPGGPDPAQERLWTPYGGMFLLLPLLDGLWDWAAATAGWPELEGVSPERVVRLLVTAAALGRAASPQAVHDSVLRLALGVPLHLDGHRLGECLATVGAGAVEDFEAYAARSEGLPPVADPDLPPSFPGPAGVVVARAASSLLRSFARRLPGMADASASYLVANLLDLHAWVGLDGDRAVVELGTPPLHVLVMMAGMDRGSFRPAGSEMTWTLTSRG